MNSDHPVIFFDGVCNLCNQSVQFVIKRDQERKFKFASLQSGFGQELLKEFNLPADHFNSFILFQDNEIYVRSTGALKMLSQLNGWSWTKVFYIIPRFIRDGIYNFIAQYRYRWFGKRNECMIPTGELKARFLE